jgi:hypothetical protein
MKEKTFVGTFTAIMLASVPIWACGLLSTGQFGTWHFGDVSTAFGSVFWIPASMLTFVVMWGLKENCRCKPALLVTTTGIVPFSILSTIFMLEALTPVLDDLFHGAAGITLAAFVGLLMCVQSAYVACSYIIAGGVHREHMPGRPAGADGVS